MRIGLERISANTMEPPSNATMPSLLRRWLFTRMTPVFRLKSSSWNTS
jgi:hypothetical protein